MTGQYARHYTTRSEKNGQFTMRDNTELNRYANFTGFVVTISTVWCRYWDSNPNRYNTYILGNALPSTISQIVSVHPQPASVLHRCLYRGAFSPSNSFRFTVLFRLSYIDNFCAPAGSRIPIVPVCKTGAIPLGDRGNI